MNSHHHWLHLPKPAVTAAGASGRMMIHSMCLYSGGLVGHGEVVAVPAVGVETGEAAGKGRRRALLGQDLLLYKVELLEHGQE